MLTAPRACLRSNCVTGRVSTKKKASPFSCQAATSAGVVFGDESAASAPVASSATAQAGPSPAIRFDVLVSNSLAPFPRATRVRGGTVPRPRGRR